MKKFIKKVHNKLRWIQAIIPALISEHIEYITNEYRHRKIQRIAKADYKRAVVTNPKDR